MSGIYLIYTLQIRNGPGILKPLFWMAAVTLSLLSLTAPSGSPTVMKLGSFEPVMWQSTSTM